MLCVVSRPTRHRRLTMGQCLCAASRRRKGMVLTNQIDLNRRTNGTAAPNLTLTGLRPSPEDLWKAMLRFSGPRPAELDAMRRTVEAVFKRGYELIVGGYDYLRSFPETAEILGWESGFDEEHLSERRRFQTMWLSRSLSIDLGIDFARYLYRAGQIHVGHGPRHIHVPGMWVSGTMALNLEAFANFIREEHTDVNVVAPALIGWNKYFTIQLTQMQAGYEVGVALDTGSEELPVKTYGRVRQEWGREAITVRYHRGAAVGDALRRLCDYAPVLRTMLFDQEWQSDESDDLWMRVTPVYRLRDNWRILRNGQDLRYYGGFDRILQRGDTRDLFPPGR